MNKYTYRVRKRDYYDVWFAEMLENGVVVRRYDFSSEDEAKEAIARWKTENTSTE